MRHPTQLHHGDVVWSKIRILVFSQDDAFRFLVRSTFRKMSVREILSTSVVADAPQFLALAPDVALIDMDGDGAQAVAFLEKLRAADAEMPVLLVAKREDKPQAEKAVPLGVEGILPKPISGHEISLRVSDTLKDPRRMAPPAPPPKPAPRVDLSPAAQGKVVDNVVPSGAAPAPRADLAAQSQAQKAELAALAARLGQSVSGGKLVDDMPGKPGKDGGTYDLGGDAPLPAKVSGGKLEFGDAPMAGPAKSGGDWSYGGDDAPKPGKVAGGKLEFGDAPMAGASTGGGKLDMGDAPQAKKNKRETLADAAPAALKLAPEPSDAEKAAEEARKAKWKKELEEAGHQERSGKDVGGFNADAIVASHMAWLTSQGVEGARANLQGKDLAGIDLGRTVLANASFREADLSDSNLAECRLDGADFRYGVLGAANLTGANLGVAQMRHADLRLAKLDGAILRGADLSGAKLRGASMAGTDMKGATLVGTDLREADLSKVEGLTQGQVEKSECDMNTKLPPGVHRPRREEA